MKRAWTPLLLLALAGCQTAVVVEPALVDMAKGQEQSSALALLKKGVDPNSRAPDGTTALQWAVHHDDLLLVEALLRAGADPNAANDYDATPLAEAAVIGNAAVIEKLVRAGAKVNLANPDGQTPLMILARTSNVAAARILLEHGADANDTEKWRGQSALMWAAAQSQPAMVRLLIERGANVNARSIVNNWERQISGEPRAQVRPAGGLTPLLYAARQGCLDCVRALVAANVEIDMADPEGITALIIAINSFHFDVAAYLVEKGANPNKWDWWGRTPLYSAVDLNTIPFGGRPDRPSLDHTTSIGIIEILLNAGANPNAQLKLFPPFRALGADRGFDNMLTIGTTPLIRAAKAGDSAAVQLLLERGALPNLPNMLGITPLAAAAGVGSTQFDTRGRFKTQAQAVECIQLLLKAGADVQTAENGGRTPLHGAAFWGWNEAVKALVAANARIDVKDAKGLTPQDWALGRAGVQGRGASIEVHEDTAALLQQLNTVAVTSR